MSALISPSVRVLSEEAVNKIAAGEVIENSSSVVKELIDNALDSGASRIRVWIKAGGRQLIRVSDDGCGMGRDDALLALERHATSKIRRAEEITSIETMGFRGEAIPSIAAVSKFTLLTAGESSATEIVVHGGKIIRCQDAARVRGTTVEVESLFFNTPVRQRFQKSVASDVGAIHRMMTELALANPSVRFQLFNENEELFAASPASLDVRIAEVLGDPFAEQLVSLGELGFIGKPGASRPNRLGQYLFINGRPVVSREVSDAVREAYGTRLTPGRHPIFVLRLNLSGDEVDINVHPQKREVRLRSKEKLQEMLTEAIHKALHRAPIPTALPSFSFVARETEEFDFSTVPAPLAEEKPLLALPNILGVLGDYILISEDDGLSLIHRRRAYARILYEQMVDKEESATQLLLAPVTLELPPAEAHRLTEILGPLNQMGYSVRSFGPRSFLVEGIPPMVSDGAIEAIFAELLHNLSGTRREKIALAASRAAACHAPPPPGALLSALFQCQEPDVSPKGKPTRIRIPLSEIKRKFHATEI